MVKLSAKNSSYCPIEAQNSLSLSELSNTSANIEYIFIFLIFSKFNFLSKEYKYSLYNFRALYVIGGAKYT